LTRRSTAATSSKQHTGKCSSSRHLTSIIAIIIDFVVVVIVVDVVDVDVVTIVHQIQIDIAIVVEN